MMLDSIIMTNKNNNELFLHITLAECDDSHHWKYVGNTYSQLLGVCCTNRPNFSERQNGKLKHNLKV